jgi:hypothetical protein
VFPNELKIAKTIPIYKSKEHNKFGNYRPISLLTSLSKIFEKLIHTRLLTYFNETKLFYEHQYGFLPRHSTEEAVHQLHNKVVHNIENKLFTLGVFLDLSKAFDTIDHNILFNKLDIYGVRGKMLALLKSYMSNRTQFVSYNNHNSKPQRIQVGVPQGSVLGPLIFLIYTNDFCRCLKFAKSFQYADDTTLVITGNSTNEINEQANEDLRNIKEWYKSNKLSLNVSKTNIVLFRSQQLKVDENSINISLDGSPISAVDSAKFLGVYLDKHMTYTAHISHICSKVSKTVGVLNRAKNVLNKNTMELIYRSLIYPYLTYCNIEWGHNYESHLKRLVILQKKGTKNNS